MMRSIITFTLHFARTTHKKDTDSSARPGGAVSAAADLSVDESK